MHVVFKMAKMKECSPNNEGKSCYLHLVQGRHDGLILPEVRVKNKSNLSALNQGELFHRGIVQG